MNGSVTKTVLAVTASLGFAVLCGMAVLWQRDESAKPMKVYGRDVADGFRVWDPKAGVDSVRFDSCRIEKVKSGPITFGGLNELQISGLVLNLPFSQETSAVTCVSATGQAASYEPSLVAGFPTEWLGKTALPFGKASAVRIRGLAVNRVVGRSTEPVFAADELRNRGKTLVLSNCRVLENGRTNLVGRATLQLQPTPLLAWNGGERRLDDLFPDRKEKNK